MAEPTGESAARDAAETAWRNLAARLAAARLAAGEEPGLAFLVAEVRSAVSSAQAATARALSWQVNRAATDARLAVYAERQAAGGPPLRVVWVAERDGCVDCVGMQGQVQDVGAAFTPESFDPRGPAPVYGDVLDGPPRHPNCRCQLTAVPAGDDGGYAEGLRREAERSIANGYALDSEPESTRLRAAEALVNRPNRLPRTVVERAQRNIDRGQIRRPFPE